MPPSASAPVRSGLPAALLERLALPVIAAPMFLVSGPALVEAACRAGIVGALPAANARSSEILDEWLDALTAALARASEPRVGPWAVNLVAHRSNARLQADLALCVRHRAPIVITALGGPQAIVQAVHGYGGLVFADVNTPEYAAKAAAWGVDGLVLVRAGLDPDNLQPRQGGFDLSGGEEQTKAWKDLWSAGQGVGQIKAIEPTRAVVERLQAEYAQAMDAELADPWMQRHLAARC